MAQVPPWMLGKHASTLIVTPQAVAADGTLSNGTAATLLASTGTLHTDLVHTVGIVDGFRIVGRKKTANISAVHRNRANHVPFSLGYEFEVAEIMRAGANNCLLAAAFHNSGSSIVKLTFGAYRRVWTVYACMLRYSPPASREKNVARLLCRQVNANVAAATYVTGDR
jgi:hypothetical protein